MAESAQTLIRAVDQTGPAWMSAQRNAAAAISGIKGMIPGLATALSAAGFINLVKGSIDAMDHLNDLSKTTGLTVESLAGLKLAARQSGGDLDSIAASVNKLAVEMGKAPEKFRELGITAKDPLEAFKQLADIFNSLEDPQQRAALGAAALGKSWQGAAPLLAEGSKKITEMIETGTRASGMTTEFARQADELNDKWMLLVGSGGLVNNAVGQMLPTMVKAVDLMLELKVATGGWYDELEKLPKLPSFGAPFLAAARVLLAAREAQEASMKLGGGPSGGRGSARNDRMLADDAAAAKAAADKAKVSKFLGLDKESLEAQKALQREIDQHNEHVRSLEEAQQQRSIELRLKHMDDVRDAELKAAKDKIELDKEILAHNREVEAAEEASIAARIAARMQALDEGKAVADSLMSPTALENLAYAERLANLKLYLESANLAQAESNAVLAQLQLEHEASLGSISAQGELDRQKFSEMSARRKAKTIFGELESITAGVAQHNRTLFELNKVAGIANAIINAYEGISLTMKSYPYPLNVGMAAAHAFAAFAQVSAIQSATFGGGGGSAPSIAGGTPAAPVTPVSSGAAGGSGQTTLVQLTGGDFYSEESVRKLLERIAETKGGKLVVL